MTKPLPGVPILTITVEKGPNEGEIVEKKRGTKVRIGRIRRRNNFQIEDHGISSNHLLIEVQDSAWVIKDLDSTNGTFLNDVQLEPNSPFTLKDGDLIKIGELTSMKVSMGEENEEEKLFLNTTQTGSSSVSVVAAEVELDDGIVPVRRNPRRGAAAVTKEQVVETKEQVVETTNSVSEVVSLGGRRGRGRKKSALKNETVEMVVDSVAEVSVGDDSELVAEVTVSECREVIGGSSKRKNVAESLEVDVEDSSKGKNVASCDTPEKSTNEEKTTLEKLNKMTLGKKLNKLKQKKLRCLCLSDKS